ncbi:hypothetical protein SB781_40675, partial [Paraburkholderia sp. SIMBA_061]
MHFTESNRAPLSLVATLSSRNAFSAIDSAGVINQSPVDAVTCCESAHQYRHRSESIRDRCFVSFVAEL